MEPILSKLEKKQIASITTSVMSPLDEISSPDRIGKSTLLHPDAVMQDRTGYTKIVQESSDEK